MRNICVLVFAVFVVGTAVATGQQKSKAESSLPSLIAALQASTWTARAEAYEQLKDDSAAMRRLDVRAALLGLLDLENHADISKETGFDPHAYHEDYGEYTDQLAATVDSIADWNDPRQVCILAHTSYNPDSRFGAQLARAGQVIVPCLMGMVHSPLHDDRYKSISVLIQLRAKVSALDPTTQVAIDQLTMSGLHDPDEGMRVSTVVAVRDFGGKNLVAALQDVANNDPGPVVQGHSVREYASKAVAIMQKRLGNGK